MFLDSTWVHTNNINTKKLCTPIPVYNIDGTPNESRAISEVADVTLRYNGHSERALFAVTQLGSQQMILGFTWLKEHNPEVNWQTKSVKMTRCLDKCRTCRTEIQTEKKEAKKAEEHLNAC